MAHPTLPLLVEALLDSQPATARLRKKKMQQLDFTFSNLTGLQAATSSFTFPSSTPSASGFGGGISGGGFNFPNLVTPPSSPPLSYDGDDF